MQPEHGGSSQKEERGAGDEMPGMAPGETMSGHDGKGDMSGDGSGMAHDHDAMMREHREKTLWTYFATIVLGFWLIASPATLGYQSAAMTWSDIASGALIVILGFVSLSPRWDTLARWAICFIGLWLLFAPLLFWAPDAAGYLNDTLIGALVIVFSVLISMPGKAHHMAMMQPGPDLPPGWSYNPSTWWQRSPMIALALVGFFISRYLAAYQLGHIESVWDPFFAGGTKQVLESEVSRAWPISDAGLGATSYMLEALMGFMGGVRRWRTMPWMVTFFGILVIPLGVTSIILIILQPLMVGAWCTLCLITALAMLIMIPLAVDEVVAMLQFMAESRRAGKPFWRTFWVGGTLPSEAKDTRSPRSDGPVAPMAPAMIWGVTVPWNLVLSALLGVWLMMAPDVFGIPIEAAAADSDRLVGALAITVAVIAMGEVTRAGRFLNVLLGGWLLVAPWILSGAVLGWQISNVVVGIALILLSIPRGAVREQYGTWNRRIV